MEIFCDRIIQYFVNRHSINAEDQDLYSYALNVLISAVVNLLTTLLISTFLRIPIQGLVFFVAFFLLRKFTGGLHASTFLRCYISSTVLSFLEFLAIKLIVAKLNWSTVEFIICSGCLLLSIIVIVLFSPFENPNKPLSENEKRIYRVVAAVLAVVFSVISIILMLNKIHYFVGTTAAIILTAFLLVISVARRNLTNGF